MRVSKRTLDMAVCLSSQEPGVKQDAGKNDWPFAQVKGKIYEFTE
jgi:hypothetical protein